MAEMDPKRTALAGRLRRAREMAGLSQGQVAKELDLHRPSVSEIEAGRRRVTAEELTDLADLYKVDALWLLGKSRPSDEHQARVELAARELTKLRAEDLDQVLEVLFALRGGSEFEASDSEGSALDEETARSSATAESRGDLITDLTAGREYSYQERSTLEKVALERSFQRRRELLEDSLTTSQVASLLGTSRQTPHDRVKGGTLLAVADRGTLRFPSWQFDSEGPDGVIEGLPEVSRALNASTLAKISWFVRPNQYLAGRTPLEAIRGGEVETVRMAADTVGMS